MTARHLSAGRDITLIQGTYIAAEAPSERLPVFEVPLAHRRWFWGRTEVLEELERAWRDDGKVALTQTLTGMGGVGKSQLAAQFAYRHREELDVVWWVSCTPRPRGRARRPGPGQGPLRSPGLLLGPPARRRRRRSCDCRPALAGDDGAAVVGGL